MSDNKKEEIDLDCIQTYQMMYDALIAVEQKLATRFKFDTNDHQLIRQKLIEMDKKNELVEDEVVADWHDLYSSFVDWNRFIEASSK